MTLALPLPFPDTAPEPPVDITTCDRCGHSGLIRYSLPGGLDLVFCGHHDREFGPAILAGGGSPLPLHPTFAID